MEREQVKTDDDKRIGKNRARKGDVHDETRERTEEEEKKLAPLYLSRGCLPRAHGHEGSGAKCIQPAIKAKHHQHALLPHVRQIQEDEQTSVQFLQTMSTVVATR